MTLLSQANTLSSTWGFNFLSMSLNLIESGHVQLSGPLTAFQPKNGGFSGSTAPAMSCQQVQEAVQCQWCISYEPAPSLSPDGAGPAAAACR